MSEHTIPPNERLESGYYLEKLEKEANLKRYAWLEEKRNKREARELLDKNREVVRGSVSVPIIKGIVSYDDINARRDEKIQKILDDFKKNVIIITRTKKEKGLNGKLLENEINVI